jgi:hypothetical protein
MSRLVLIHWNSKEGAERIQELQALGHNAEVCTPDGGAGLRPHRENPPQLFVIDLNRIPSQGRAVAILLRQQKGTRMVPLVFAGGKPEKVTETQKLLPDATYTSWEKIGGAITRALKNAPKTPVVPNTMAGYSGSPLPKKLGIREGAVVALLGAPKDFSAKLGPLPEGTKVKSSAKDANVALLFVKSEVALREKFPAVAQAMAEKAAFWIAWPKQASGVKSDLSERNVREYGLAQNWVDYKICAVNEIWSGLCFARRKAKS